MTFWIEILILGIVLVSSWGWLLATWVFVRRVEGREPRPQLIVLDGPSNKPSIITMDRPIGPVEMEMLKHQWKTACESDEPRIMVFPHGAKVHPGTSWPEHLGYRVMDESAFPSVAGTDVTEVL